MTPPPSQPTDPSHDPWADCTFEGAERATILRGASLSFAEKLAWLEEAQRLAMQLQNGPRSQPFLPQGDQRP